MGNSKIIYNDETLIDLTEDTVSADTLLLGVTAHDASGEEVTGTVSTLPNPNKLTFTGAVEAEYDGSEAITVNIPAGGEGGAGGYYVPDVDAEGNLSWTASNADMPDVESTNIKGNDGVGIQSVEQTTTSTEDNGENIITVTKTDGTQSTFGVRNGSKGSDGTSPTVETTEIENGHEVTFTDVNSSKVIKVMDGAALLYVVSEGETIEEARIAAKAAGARFIFNPYASNSVEYVTAESFNTLFDARNGAVLLWSGSWTSGDITIAETDGTAGCTGSGNFSDFEKFFINVGNAFFECQIDSLGYLNGQGGYMTSGGVRYLRFIRFAVSGNTVTYTSHKSAYLMSSGTTLEDSTAAVAEIYGIPIR